MPLLSMPETMPVSDHNGLSNCSSLKQSSVLTKIAATVSLLRGAWTDQDMADEWGVSAGTVSNAQNQRHELSLMAWLRLGKRFGTAGLNPVLSLLRMKAVRDDAIVIDLAKVPLKVASALPLLMQVMGDNECCDGDVRKLEEAGAIDEFVALAAYLEQRRSAIDHFPRVVANTAQARK
jgi:hypothetical protein